MPLFDEHTIKCETDYQRDLVQTIASSLRTRPEHDMTLGRKDFFWLGRETGDNAGMHVGYIRLRNNNLTSEVTVRLDYNNP